MDQPQVTHPKPTDLASRTISAFPVSISTSLALESIFPPRLTPYDDTRKLPPRVDLSEYQEIWINLLTLFRNIATSVPQKVFLEASEVELKNVLETEIDVINSLFSTEGNGICRPQYYYCTYLTVFAFAQKNVAFRKDSTEFQKFFTFKFLKVMELLFKDTDEHFKFVSSVKGDSNVTSLILTHIPYDLLSYRNFRKLTLLESHTGITKERHQWNTKYTKVPDRDMSILPFSKRLLFIFGDNYLVAPAPIALRRQILDTAKARGWTAMTTDEKVLLDLSIDIKEPFVLKFIRGLQ